MQFSYYSDERPERRGSGSEGSTDRCALLLANEKLQQEIEERERAEQELRVSEAPLRGISSQLMVAQEKE
jgi:hypothetical protein